MTQRRHDKTGRHDLMRRRDDTTTQGRCCQCPCALSSLYDLRIYLKYEQGLKPFELGAHALVPAGVACKSASTDENH
jgi:hypothetical protein